MIDAYDLDLSVIWSEESIVVVNNTAVLTTLPDGYDKACPRLAQVLAPECGRTWIAHRLDRSTSGVIVVARTAEAHRVLNLQVRRRRAALASRSQARSVKC